MSGKPDIFMIAGEASGDLIGSLLIRELLRRRPGLVITANGGAQMAEAGAELRLDMLKDFSIVGFVEVIAKFSKIRRLFHDTLDYIRENRPRAVVLIDYPGFNLRIAKAVHEMGIPVIYYVIPQVWAWHKSRVHSLAKYADRSLVIFPFEAKLIEEVGGKVTYVGHPLLDIMVLTMGRDEVFDKFGLDRKKKLIGLLPGSRRREVDTLLPVMLDAAERIRDEMPQVQFVIPRATSVKPEHLDRYISRYSVDVTVVDSHRYNVRSTMDMAMVASGTATLETGLLLCPMVIMYKMAYPSWLIAKTLVKIPYAGLINIIAGDMVVPELLQDQCTPQNVAERCLAVLRDPREVERIRYQLGGVKNKLGGPGASGRAAETILHVIEAGGAGSDPGASGDDAVAASS